MSNDTLVIAQRQRASIPADTTAALAELEESMATAAGWGVSLLVIPEMAITGYNLRPDEVKTIAEPTDGALFTAVANLCTRYNMGVVYGYAELGADGNIYNAAQLIDATGKALLNYRKAHLWGDLDRQLFAAGDTLSAVVDFQGWKVSLAICYDAEFPETVRHAAVQGAELVLVPTALMSPWSDVATRLIPMRAYENRLFVAYTNYVGDERGIDYVGHSCIADPNGNLLAQATDQPVLLSATLDRDVLRKAREGLPYLANRRPELYDSLSRQS